MNEKAPSDHNHDSRYYTKTDINDKLLNSSYYDYKTAPEKFGEVDPSNKFANPDGSSDKGWMIFTKSGKRAKFTAALKIETNFSQNIRYRICSLPIKAYGTQYGFAISQDTGKSLIILVENANGSLYVQTKGYTLLSGDWIWINLDVLCQK